MRAHAHTSLRTLRGAEIHPPLRGEIPPPCPGISPPLWTENGGGISPPCVDKYPLVHRVAAHGRITTRRLGRGVRAAGGDGGLQVRDLRSPASPAPRAAGCECRRAGSAPLQWHGPCAGTGVATDWLGVDPPFVGDWPVVARLSRRNGRCALDVVARLVGRWGRALVGGAVGLVRGPGHGSATDRSPGSAEGAGSAEGLAGASVGSAGVDVAGAGSVVGAGGRSVVVCAAGGRVRGTAVG